MSRLQSVTALLGLFLITISAAALTGCSAPEGNAAEGKRWYGMHNCHACHGENGNDGKGPNIAAPTMSHRQFVDRLRNTQTAVMPAYGEEKISDQDAADILAFLQSIK